jgi:hypothetical protein
MWAGDVCIEEKILSLGGSGAIVSVDYEEVGQKSMHAMIGLWRWRRKWLGFLMVEDNKSVILFCEAIGLLFGTKVGWDGWDDCVIFCSLPIAVGREYII